MITRNRLTHLISIMTIGLYSGVSDASNEKKQKSKEDYFRECPNNKFEKFMEHNYNRATQEVYDPIGAQHMQTARGLTKEDMSACVGRNQFQTKEEVNKIYGSMQHKTKKDNKNSPHG
jgi:hypothetical protein